MGRIALRGPAGSDPLLSRRAAVRPANIPRVISFNRKGFLMADTTARARAHAKHAYFCSCGKIVHGNGGKANHAYMHEQRQDGHRYLITDEFYRRFPGARGGPTNPSTIGNQAADEADPDGPRDLYR